MNCDIYNPYECMRSNDCFLCTTDESDKCISKFSDEKRTCQKANKYTHTNNKKEIITNELHFDVNHLIQSIINYTAFDSNDFYTISLISLYVGITIYLLT